MVSSTSLVRKWSITDFEVDLTTLLTTAMKANDASPEICVRSGRYREGVARRSPQARDSLSTLAY